MSNEYSNPHEYSEGQVSFFYAYAKEEDDPKEALAFGIEITRLFKLLQGYYTQHTGLETYQEDVLLDYFINDLNIDKEADVSFLLRIARVIEKNNHKKNYKITLQDLTGVGAW